MLFARAPARAIDDALEGLRGRAVNIESAVLDRIADVYGWRLHCVVLCVCVVGVSGRSHQREIVCMSLIGCFRIVVLGRSGSTQHSNGRGLR